MEKRIAELTDDVVKGKVWFETKNTEYDRENWFMSPVLMSAKRASEYVLNQEPIINDKTGPTGYFRFDGSVEGDIFTLTGHKNFWIAYENFYNKPIDGFATFEWQHSVADFQKVLDMQRALENFITYLKSNFLF